MSIPMGVNLLPPPKKTIEQLLEELSNAIGGLTTAQKSIVDLLQENIKFQKSNSDSEKKNKNNDSKLNSDFYSWVRSELPKNHQTMFDEMHKNAERMEKYISINEQILKKAQKNDDTMLSFVEVMKGKEYKSGANQIASDYGDQRRQFQDKNFGRTMFDFASEQIPLLGLLTKNYTDAPGSAKNRRAEQAKVMADTANNKYQNYKEDAFTTHVFGEEKAKKHKEGKAHLSNYEDTMMDYGSKLYGEKNREKAKQNRDEKAKQNRDEKGRFLAGPVVENQSDLSFTKSKQNKMGKAIPLAGPVVEDPLTKSKQATPGKGTVFTPDEIASMSIDDFFKTISFNKKPHYQSIKNIDNNTSNSRTPHFNMAEAIAELYPDVFKSKDNKSIAGPQTEEGSSSDEAIKHAKKTPADKISRSDLTKLPAAYSAGFLYLGDLIGDNKSKEGEKQKIDVHQSGGGLGSIKSMLPSLLTMVVAALPAVLAVGAGALLINFLLNAAAGERPKQTKKIIDQLTPQEQTTLAKKGIDTTKITQLEDAQAAKALADGSKGSAIAINLNDQSMMNPEIVRAKNEANANAFTTAKNLLGDYTAGGGYSFKKEKDGSYIIYSPDGTKHAQVPSLDQQSKWSIERHSPSMDKNHIGSVPMLERDFDRHIDGGKGQPVKFSQGGFVPGNKGDAVPIIAHAGEQVRNQGEVSNDFKELKDLMKQQIDINTQLLEEMKKNTEVTDKKELKVETPQPHPQANRNFVKG